MRVKRKAALLLAGIVLSAALLGGCGLVEGAASGFVKKHKIENGFQKKYVPSAYTQADVDCDTVQWFCSAYAIYTHLNRKDLKMIGGTAPENEKMHEQAIKRALDSGWGITGRRSAFKKINWILSGGHRKKCREIIADMKKEGLLSAPQEEMEYTVYQMWEDDFRKYICAYHAYREFGENAVDAWDYCRALQVLGDCYQADYISLEECLDESLVIAKKLQSTFAGWEDVCKSYLYGYYYWSQSSVDTEWRWEIYQELSKMEDGPYTIPYDTELKESWKGAKKGGAAASKKEKDQDGGQEDETSDEMWDAGPKTDEEGRYILLSDDGKKEAAVSAPGNYIYSEEDSDEDTLVFESVPDESGKVIFSESFRFYMKELTEDYTAEMVETIARDNAERRRTSGVYEDVRYADTQKTKAGDFTVYYNSTSGLAGTEKKVCDGEWAAWMETKDGYLVYCLSSKSTYDLDSRDISEERVKEIMSLVNVE